MEQVPVGIYGDGRITHLPGSDYNLVKIRVQGGFPAEKNQVGIAGFIYKKLQPCSDGIDRKGIITVLHRINITMGARKIAFGQDMKKDINAMF